MQKIVNSLNSEDKPRLLTLIGNPGVGKTQCALYALRYLRDRAHNFNLGAIYNGDMLAHMNGNRRRRRTRETFHDIIKQAIIGNDSNDDKNVYELINRTTTEKPCILLLDGCDLWLSATNFSLGEEIGKLAQYCVKLTIIVTSIFPLMDNHSADEGDFMGRLGAPALVRNRSSNHCYAETVIKIPKLSNYNTAELLCLRANRKLSMAEMYGGLYVANSCGKIDALQSLGESDIIAALGGNPQVVENLSTKLPNLLEFENKILNSIVPEVKMNLLNRNIWRLSCGSQNFGKFGDVAFWFRKLVTVVKLTDNEMKFLATTFAEGKALANFKDILVREADYAKLWDFWSGCVEAIERIGVKVWKKFVRGFLTREESQRLLADKDSGSYVVRVSTERACLAVVVKLPSGALTNVKVKPDKSNASGWFVGDAKFDDLEQLVNVTELCDKVVI